LVIFHDPILSRTTNGTGKVRDATLSEIKALDAAFNFSIKAKDGSIEYPQRGKGIKVPLFSEFLQSIPGFESNLLAVLRTLSRCAICCRDERQR
jgi:glycerophosphoryl diester phosphodiesterase